MRMMVLCFGENGNIEDIKLNVSIGLETFKIAKLSIFMC